ncbi:hypothetical protein BJX61DRAFT_541402 [Aspergillus egyptiacus]|nr:hypothetical protein BJX61DRAFT_541402 [Aspergillus egyptiacus]
MRRLQQLLSASPARPLSQCFTTNKSLPRFLSTPNPISASQSHPLGPQTSNPNPPLRHLSTTSAQNNHPSSPFRLTSTPTPTPTSERLSSAATPDDPIPNTNSDAPYINPNTGEYHSPYKPKRAWPPDMSKLSPKHQFRLERKYRRRAALKYARPKWTKATKLVQWGGIGFVLLYALLFMEWDDRGGKPIEEIRKYIFGSIKEAFSAPPAPASMRRPEGSVRE